MILGYNPAGNCFVLRDLVLIKFFQIRHNCVTEWMMQAKFLLELFQYVIILSNRRGKFKF